MSCSTMSSVSPRSSGPRRLLQVLASVLPLMTTVASPGFADWPQWRGPDGLGIATGPHALPETWSPESPTIEWRTEIPGEGISSPIVRNGRVFVTTAYQGPDSQLTETLIRVATAALALVCFVMLRRGRRRERPEEASRSPSEVAVRDRRVVMATSFGFVILALAITLVPGLFYSLGEPPQQWKMVGAVSLLGLASAFGQFRRDSTWRLVGTAVILLAAAPLVYLTPHGPLGPSALPKKMLPAVLPLALATWYVFSFRRSRDESERSSFVSSGKPTLAAVLLLLSSLVFIPPTFLTGLQRVVVCLDLESGELLWQRAVLRGPPEQKWTHNTYATPTPATDGEHVFAFFGHGLASVDYDGEPQWHQHFPEYSRSTRYGSSASPILTDDSVIVIRESEANQAGPPSWIASFDKRSGRLRWRITPPETHDSYVTPMMLRSDSGTQMLIATWERIVAYDADSGRELWSHDYPMQQMVASMARLGNVLAVTGGAHGHRELIVFRLAESSDTRAKTLWKTNRGVAAVVSPVLYDGRLYSVTTPGIMTCYEAETGAELWKTRLPGEYFASLVAGDGKVYAVNTEGTTTVLAADSELGRIAENKLDDEVYASPAIAGDRLLIRTASSLSSIRSAQ